MKMNVVRVAVLSGLMLSVPAIAQYASPPEPNYGPASGSMTFKDTDPGETIGGVLAMGRALNSDGTRVDERNEGIKAYITHWGLEVGAPGTGDDKGNGDLGGDCKGFRDTNHITMVPIASLNASTGNLLEMEIPQGTKVPADAVYFVGHTVYADGNIHNLNKCIQIPVVNWVE